MILRVIAPSPRTARTRSNARRRLRTNRASPLDNVRFALCRPEGPTNVGSALARAMQNFGLKDLKVVNAAPSVLRDGTIDDDAYKYAVHASWMLDGAVEEDIASACADRTFVVATTARPRENVPLLSLRDGVQRIREELANGARVVVLFGNERTGLTNEELTYANIGVKVPTAGDRAAPNDGADASSSQMSSKKYTGGSGASSGTGSLTPVSLNLGMCVGVVAYELFNQLSDDDVGNFRDFKSHQLTVFEKKRLIEDLIAARQAVDILAGSIDDDDDKEQIYRDKEARQIARVLSGTIASRDAVSFFFLARRILAIAEYANIDDGVLAAARLALEANPDAGAKKINAAVQNALDITLTQRELNRVLAAIRRA